MYESPLFFINSSCIRQNGTSRVGIICCGKWVIYEYCRVLVIELYLFIISLFNLFYGCCISKRVCKEKNVDLA